MEKIKKEIIDKIMDGKEKKLEILKDSNVAMIYTQSWCPQWGAVKEYINNIGNNIKVFYVEYDNEDFFDEFRDFKEKRWNNKEVPYIRYFKDGEYIGDSNYVNIDQFLRFFG